MKIAITGHTGFVGSHLVEMFGYEPIVADILNEEELVSENGRIKPDIVIHCAAMTDVEECEKDPKKAFQVNVRGTLNIVNTFNVPIIYLSTDHVFKGNPKSWLPKENTKPNPINIYGLTKYSGEVIVKTSLHPTLIVRSSKLYSFSTLQHDIYELKQGNKREFTDLIRRNFTHVNQFANAINTLTNRSWIANFDTLHTLHVASPVVFTYYGFWKAVAKILGLDEDLVLPRRYELDGVAPRPFHGGLAVSLSALGIKVGGYTEMVKEEFENAGR
jgi:dTDP-4-dehydrorhamnose reductase